ncbi:MAG: DUF6265 family protein [Pirellulales bacterium]
MHSRRFLAMLAIVLALGATIVAQEKNGPKRIRQLEPNAESPKAKLSDLQWIVGTWNGKGLGGNNDEVWSSAESGSMMGMYRHHKDGKIVFYELMIITEEKGSLLLRIKHFDAQLKGWESREESKEFPLVAVEKDAVYFAGLSFHRVNANRIDVDVAIQGKDGKSEELRFEYQRVANQP